MAKTSEALVGIDLGTTNSVVSHIDAHGRPTPLTNSEGDLLTPSVVFFESEGPAIVGKEALKAGLAEPEALVEAVKRDMGKKFFHREVRGKQLPPAAVSGVILHRLLSDVADRLGKVERAVVTVPAYFNEPRRKSTMDAAMMAGLKEVELLNEPTAAALAFGFEMGVFTEEGKLAKVPTKRPGEFSLLVYDLGGGTFDLTLMRIKDRHFQALVCDGDVQLGGRDWDDRIVQYLVGCFEREFGVDVRESPEFIQELWSKAEEVKRSLTQRPKATLRAQYQDNLLAVELTRDDILELTRDLLERTRLTCELVMMDGKMTWEEMDAVLLVGGSSRMPMVSDMLRELTGLEPNRSVSPDLAVAQGAALYSQMLWGDHQAGKVKEGVKLAKGAKITNVNSHSLGIVGRSRKNNERLVSVLIPKNTAIPHSNSKVFKTRKAGQDRIYIEVVEGESTDPEDCTVIGECRLHDLPPNLPADWPVTVTFAYRRDGRIFVEATVQGAEPFQVEIDRTQDVSAEEMEDWASELIGSDNDPNPNEHKPRAHAKVIPVNTKEVTHQHPPDEPTAPVAPQTKPKAKRTQDKPAPARDHVESTKQTGKNKPKVNPKKPSARPDAEELDYDDE